MQAGGIRHLGINWKGKNKDVCNDHTLLLCQQVPRILDDTPRCPLARAIQN